MYTNLLCRTYDAIKAVAPTAKVAGGVLASANRDFLERMLDAGAGDCMDVLSIHLYVYRPTAGYSVPSGSPARVGVDRFMEIVADRRALLVARGHPMNIIVTETGFHGSDTPASQQLRAEFVTELYSRARTLPYLKGIWWFELEDSPGQHGLVYGNNVKKPAFAAFKAEAAKP